MKPSRNSVQLSSKYVGTLTKLFQGFTPKQISPNQNEEEFWIDILSLGPNLDFLTQKISSLSKEDCLHTHKHVFSSLFAVCLQHAQQHTDPELLRTHAVKTLAVTVRCVLAKNLAGWEVMEIFAGDGLIGSDAAFTKFATIVDTCIGDGELPASFRHSVLQLALIFACGINQLSPGAYLLRRDLFPSITTFIKSPETERYTFEAILLLSVLANFHKSDAAKLNPYLQKIRNTNDQALMRKLCWAANYAADAAVKAYREKSDDSVPTLAKSFGSLLTSLRPDRVLASDPPRELFKDQPIEAAVVLLPVFEFLHLNPLFANVLVESMSSTRDEKPQSTQIPPPPFTLLTLSSYLLTHASSSSSSRAIAYANLSINMLLVMAENATVMDAFCQPVAESIKLCQQRLPVLPTPPSPRPPLCALLDCVVLWFRHNLHKKLEVNNYVTCVRICNRVVWYLQKKHIRLEYDWVELWTSIIGLLAFLSSKLDNLTTTGGVEQLIQETVCFLDFAVCQAELYLPSPRSLHEFIYELVRSSSVLAKKKSVLKTLGMPIAPSNRRASMRSDSAGKALAHLLLVVEFYENKLTAAGSKTATDAMRVVAREIEKEGLHGVDSSQETDDPPSRSEDVVGFIRTACVDGLMLMP